MGFSKILNVEFGGLAIILEPKSRFMKDPTDAKDHSLKVHAMHDLKSMPVLILEV